MGSFHLAFLLFISYSAFAQNDAHYERMARSYVGDLQERKEATDRRLQGLAVACMRWRNQTNQANLRSISVRQTSATLMNHVVQPMIDSLTGQDRNRYTVQLRTVDAGSGQASTFNDCLMTVSPHNVMISCDWPRGWQGGNISCHRSTLGRQAPSVNDSERGAPGNRGERRGSSEASRARSTSGQ